MAKQVIPWHDYPDFKQTVLLDGKVYIFHIKYNTQFDYYTLDVLSATSLPIIQGVRLVANMDTLNRFKIDSLPKGSLIPVALTVDAIANKANMGTNVLLVYDSITL